MAFLVGTRNRLPLYLNHGVKVRPFLLEMAENACFVTRFVQQSINFQSIAVRRPAV